MTKERLIKLKEDAEIMLIRQEHNPELKKIYCDINFRYLIEDINAYLGLANNPKKKPPHEGFYEPTPEELEQIAFMFS